MLCHEWYYMVEIGEHSTWFDGFGGFDGFDDKQTAGITRRKILGFFFIQFPSIIFGNSHGVDNNVVTDGYGHLLSMAIF